MLIIYAHPNKQGFSGAFLKVVEKRLKQNKTKYEVLDLYEMNYDPILKQSEHYTSGNYDISDVNKEIQAKIQAAKQLIFIYPIWWQNMPAILKGFVDHVFTPRFAYKYVNKIPMGLLKNKKALVLVSTGSPRWFEKLYFQDCGIKVLTKDTLNFCGIKTKSFVFGSTRSFDEVEKIKIEKIVDKGLRFLV